jgi:hypothetical protein
MPAHIVRWEYSNDTIVNWSSGYFHNMGEWNTEVDTIQLFFDNRAHYMRTYIMQQFGISDTSQLTVNVVPPAGGVVSVDSFAVPSNPCALVYFNGYASTLTAHANPGYIFSGWTTAGGDTLPLFWIPNGDTTVNAYFTPFAVSIQEPSGFSGSIYPNPANEQIIVELSARDATSLQIELDDMMGRPVYRGTAAACTTCKRQISTRNLAPGLYCLSVRSGMETWKRDVVIVR